MKKFEVLRQVRVDSNLYLNHEADFLGWKYDTPCLWEVLPASIEIVELDSLDDIRDLQTLTLGLKERKAMRMPNLKEIVCKFAFPGCWNCRVFAGYTEEIAECLEDLFDCIHDYAWQPEKGMVFTSRESRSAR